MYGNPCGTCAYFYPIMGKTGECRNSEKTIYDGDNRREAPGVHPESSSCDSWLEIPKATSAPPAKSFDGSYLDF
jgi:hypothetical protein